MTDTLAPLLVKWLTHDLATPAATVLTASELLSDIPDAEINDLVTAGARRLAARLRLIRAALAPGDAPIGGAALQRLVGDGTEGTPLSWSGHPQGAPPAVIAGAVLLLADLRRGQPLAITPHGATWTTPQPPLPAAVAAALTGAPPTDPRSALAAMLHATAARAGITLTADDTGLRWAEPPRDTKG